MRILKAEMTSIKKNKTSKKRVKTQEILGYLPIQKSLKMLPNISSTSTFPTIMPK